MRQPSTIIIAILCLLPSAAKAGASKESQGSVSKESQGSVKWFCGQFETALDKGGNASHAVQQCIELINSGVAQQRFRYKKDVAITCAQGQPTCASVLTGNIAAGGACESSLDCQQALVCIGLRGGPPGQCTKPLASGQTCNEEVGAGRFFAAALAKRGACSPGLHCAHRDGAADHCTKD